MRWSPQSPNKACGTQPMAAKVTHLAFGIACWNVALLFLAHGSHGEVPAALHGLLVAVLATLGTVAVWEARGLSRAVGLWLRTGLMVLAGTWFIQIAYSLYRIGFDPARENGMERVFLYFSWHVLAIGGVLAGVSAWTRRRRTQPGGLG